MGSPDPAPAICDTGPDHGIRARRISGPRWWGYVAFSATIPHHLAKDVPQCCRASAVPRALAPREVRIALLEERLRALGEVLRGRQHLLGGHLLLERHGQ